MIDKKYKKGSLSFLFILRCEFFSVIINHYLKDKLNQKMKTSEQQAIDKFLALPPINHRGACACIGAQFIKGFVITEEPYNIELKNPEQRSKFVIQVHKYFNITLKEAKEKVDSHKVDFDNPFIAKKFNEELGEAGIETEVIKKPTGLYPDCHCRMRNIIEVDGSYYKVKENKSNTEMHYNVYFLGKVGGPYLKIDD